MIKFQGLHGHKHALLPVSEASVNYSFFLGHFLLTNLLMTELVAAKPSRIVTVSSLAAEFSPPIR